VLNSARSGFAETRRESGGMILCSMVQMGGIIYVAFMLIIAVVLLQCLPLINLFTRMLFDATVAACTAVSGDGGAKKKAGKGLAGAIKAQVAKQVQAAMSGTMGGMPRVPTGAAVATNGLNGPNGHGAFGGAVGNVRFAGTDANAARLPEGLRTAMRRRRRAEREAKAPPPAPEAPTVTAAASLVNDVRGIGRRLFGNGGSNATDAHEKDSLLTRGSEPLDNSAYI